MSLLQLTESILKSNYAFQGGTGGEGEVADREKVVGSFLFYLLWLFVIQSWYKFVNQKMFYKEQD